MKLLLTLIIVALLLFSGCSNLDGNIDVKELGNNLCVELGYNILTDSLGSLNIHAYYINYYQQDNKYYIVTDIQIECDSKKIFKNIVYYDPKRQTIDYTGMGYNNRLGKTSYHKCIEYDKWGYCSNMQTTYPEGEAKLLLG